MSSEMKLASALSSGHVMEAEESLRAMAHSLEQQALTEREMAMADRCTSRRTMKLMVAKSHEDDASAIRTVLAALGAARAAVGLV